jgi:Fe-S cluster biogenesis protein NfuA
VNVDAVGAAIEEMAQVLRADGGDLRLIAADPKTARIEVELELDGVECLDCIMPSAMLRQIVSDAVGRHDPGEFELILRDPRVPRT